MSGDDNQELLAKPIVIFTHPKLLFCQHHRILQPGVPKGSLCQQVFLLLETVFGVLIRLPREVAFKVGNR
jgi:hypothetical protein